MIKAIIFDLDGVLVHTDQLHYLAWKKIADEAGIYFDEEINNRLRGVSRLASFEIILERATRPYTTEEKVLLTTKKNNYYRALLETLSPADLAPGTIAFLDELKRRKLLLAIGSSSQNARMILNKLEIIDYFDFISDGIGLVEPKPAPEVFLKAAVGLKISPQNALVIEDAKAGIDAALNGGFIGVGIGDAASYVAAEYKIKDLPEVLTILDKLN